MKTSNKLTLIRLLYAPIFFLLYYVPIIVKNDTLAAIFICIAIPLLILAELTDGLDGFFARKNNEVSDFGKLFDPFADVILHVSSFVCLMFSYDPTARGVLTEDSFNIVRNGYMPVYLFVVIFYREFGQNFLRMVSAKKGVAIAARKGGKFKTVMYVVAEFYAVFLELLVRINHVPQCFAVLKTISFVIFLFATILSWASFVDYLNHFGKALTDD